MQDNKPIMFMLIGVVLVSAVVAFAILYQKSQEKPTVTVTESTGTNVGGILKFLALL